MQRWVLGMVLMGLMLLTSIGHAQIMTVTLLGTGFPQPQIDRFGPAVLVEAGKDKLLFDAGRGIAQRVYQLYIPFSQLTRVFITHMHYDHIVGLPDLFLSGWEFQRSEPMEVWGPPGIKDHLNHIVQAYQIDIKVRQAHSGLPSRGIEFIAHEISADVIYNNNGVKVTAFAVNHQPVRHAFGFRVDYAGRSLVISGDTRYASTVIEQAKGVDLLIHELAVASREMVKHNPRLQRILSYHTSPKDLATILANTKPRLAVLTHVIAFDTKEKTLLDEVKKGHSVAVKVGRDLMAFDLGETIVQYQRPRQ